MTRAARDNDLVEDLVERGVLTPEELVLIKDLEQYQRSMVMWAWNERLLLHACEENNIAWNIFVAMVQECCDARTGIQTIHTYLRTQIPFAYVHLITFIVNVNNVTNSSLCGMYIAIALQNISKTGSAKSEDVWMP